MWKSPRSLPGFLSAVRPANKHSGMALVMVLACLVLIAGLLVAFLQVVRTDLNAARGYASGAEARRLADSTLNLVIGQMQKATGNASVAWMSQPGLIRTFDTAGQPLAAYKLYSSDVLEVIGEFNPVSDTPPADWASFPDLFTDLNPPLRVAGKTVYPILDASALNQAGVLDADGTGEPDIEGFSVNDPNFFAPANGEQPARLAMPVRWLYVLQDGSYALATAAPGGGVRLRTLSGAPVDKSNPPVARLAFWTDDESSKVNINTASAGTPWDTPVASVWPEVRSSVWDNTSSHWNKFLPRPSHWPDTFFEVDFAAFQPAQNEYQRYPGHPATTTLMPVLGVPVARAGGLTTQDQIKEALISLNPRYSGGNRSSMGGTILATAPLDLKKDRLYASTDELLFSSAYDASNGRVENSIEINPAARREFLDKAKFFITSNSRAPEVTLSNRPRVVAWPVHAQPNPSGANNVTRSSFDELIAFCGTVGTGANAQPFYFTRSNPLRSSADWTANNRRLYRYLQMLTSRPIPGFGGNFLAKFGADRDQILTQIVDYIRCLNLQDPLVSQPYTSRTDNSTRGMVVPLIPPEGTDGAGTKGFGRLATITELGILVVNRQPPTGSAEPPPPPGHRRIQVALIPEIYSPMVGYSVQAINMKVIFEGLNGTGGNGLRINGQPVTFPSGTVEMFANRIPSHWASSSLGGNVGPGALLRTDIRGGTHPRSLPPTSVKFDVPEGDGTFTINQGSRVTVRIEAPFTANNNVVNNPDVIQNFVFTVDRDVRLPLPDPTGNATAVTDVPIIPEPNRPESRVERASTQNGPIGVIQAVDRLVSLVPSGASGGNNLQGDHRLIAADHPDNDSGRFFALHPNAGTAASGRAHSLRNAALGGNALYRDVTSGNLVMNLGGYGETNARPDVPPDVNGVTMRPPSNLPGDWDNGPALNADGAFVNKADEGAGLTAAVTGAQFRDRVPYIGHLNYSAGFLFGLDTTLFSPNRQMPSPVMFGSLPVGVKRGLRWQTLHFRPDWLIPAALPGSPSHPGASSPPDHLLLDNFWMPVVEPYAISEPFSTAGKINLNYQIAPFSYIRRDTGVRAVLATGLITALAPNSPNAVGSGITLIQRYKQGRDAPDQGFTGAAIRFGIDTEATLRFFQERFTANRPFISASEICTIPLVPDRRNHTMQRLAADNDTAAQLRVKLGQFWQEHRLTGDNSLERPYAHIYPRVTTKSNTFTVHVFVQSLQKTSRSEPDMFQAGKDLVVGEFRGSFLIERYLDLQNVTFDMSDPEATLGPYKVRILNSKQL